MQRAVQGASCLQHCSRPDLGAGMPRAINMAAARRSVSNVMYHGKVYNSIFDTAFKHVILEFPQASGDNLGMNYLLHFVRHYEEDLWHGFMNKVIVQVGRTSVDECELAPPVRPEEAREQTLENVGSIVLRHDRWSNDVEAVEHDAMPQLSPTRAVMRGSGPQGLPKEIVLSLHETNSRSNPGAMRHEGELQEYRLTPTTQEALAGEIAGVYPSRRMVDIIHQRLLKRI